MYHGNWCGPGWSNGASQASVRGTAPSTDEFDETCRQHDFTYADHGDLRSADLLFARQNFGRGVVRSVAAVGVGMQGLLRSHDEYLPTIYQSQETETMVTKTSQKLRGASSQQMGAKKTPVKEPSGPRQANGLTVSAAPTAIGTAIRAVKPYMTRSLTEGRIAGRDFIGTVEGQGVATFGLGKSALLSPAYFSSTILGNLARSFERYRWNRLRVHYVPKVATTVTGQVILCSSKSVSEPCLSPESGTFLQRAMSQGNAVFSPLWSPTYIDIDCTGDWRLVDPATTSDLDDNIHEELQVFTQVNTVGQVGYLFAEYDVSFSEPIYQPHSINIPIPTGPGVRTILSDTAGVNAVNDDWVLNDAGPLNLAGTANGTIFRGVFDLQGSTAATGTTFANMINASTYVHTTTAATGVLTTPLPMVGGTTLYFAVNGTTLYVYSTLEQAINGVGSGQMFFRTASTLGGAYNFDMAVVHYGNSINPTVQ